MGVREILFLYFLKRGSGGDFLMEGKMELLEKRVAEVERRLDELEKPVRLREYLDDPLTLKKPEPGSIGASWDGIFYIGGPFGQARI